MGYYKAATGGRASHCEAASGIGATTGRGFMVENMLSHLTILWLTVLGGVIGSFLNVVIYRLPRGMSLIEPPSHCPTCKQPIRWRDNVPVFGWMLLRGRCRSCKAAVSMRYPAVEATTAAVFGLLGAVEYVSGGMNLPDRPVELIEGVFVTGRSGVQLYGIYAYHLLLLCTLLCAVLIEFDGKPLPVRLFVPAWAVGLAAPVAWPHLHPVAAFGGFLQGPAAGLVDGLTGAAVGVVLGLAAWRAWRNKKQTGMIFAAGCTGLFLGWQAVLVLSLVSATVQLFAMLLGRRWPSVRRIPPAAWLASATLVWIIAWAPLVQGWNSG